MQETDVAEWSIQLVKGTASAVVYEGSGSTSAPSEVPKVR